MTDTPTREALATQLDHHLQTWGDLRMLSLDEGKQIIAALRAVPPAPAVGWQPMETAPKDGTKVLLSGGWGRSIGPWIRTGYWARRIECWSLDAVVALPEVTHWLPLPPVDPAREER